MPSIFKNEKNRTIFTFAVSLLALILSFLNLSIFPFDTAWIAVILCGIPIIKETVIGLVTEFDLKADVLVSIALVASLIIGEIFAAGEIAFIMTIGAYLEERTVAKARAGIEKLVRLTPTFARLVRNGEEVTLPAEQVKRGDILRVLAGESIPVDGTIVKGQTSVNQSVMTGESLPVDKREGDEVFSGTINQFGTFDMVAQKVGEDRSIQRMIRLVASADAGKAKIVGIADRWATWIVLTALAAAILTWFATGEIIRSVTILVVFCPCALVLATPTAIMAGIGNASKHGILIREGDALERLAQINRIAFDKTGTLTYGKPTVVQIECILPTLSKESFLELCACAELRSEHPLGKAIVTYYKETNGHLPKEAQDFTMLPGLGILAKVENQQICAGNTALFEQQEITIPKNLIEKAELALQEGSTVLYFAVNSVPAGFLALADTLRPDAANTLEKIYQTGVQSLLLTGDAPQAAQHMAKLCNIQDFKANCLPQDKLSTIQEYQKNHELLCMIGDGVNDAPALKNAHVGVAMGGIGSDIAIEAADMVLVRDDIQQIPHLLQLAQKTMQTIKINLTLSMTLNFIAIAFAISGILNPVAGALVHNVGSVAVILHSAKLLRWKKAA